MFEYFCIYFYIYNKFTGISNLCNFSRYCFSQFVTNLSCKILQRKIQVLFSWLFSRYIAVSQKQSSIQNIIKHLRWSLTAVSAVTYFRKTLQLRCLIGFWMFLRKVQQIFPCNNIRKMCFEKGTGPKVLSTLDWGRMC